MRISRIGLAVLALTSGITLGGCAYDMYGDPYGYGYGPRSSVSIGIGYGGYGYGGYGSYGGYGYGYPYGGYGYGSYDYPYGGYGYGYPYGGYGYDPFGWYGDYYYPGTGVYVYDRSRTRHVWSGDQQRYWMQRRQQWQNHGGTTTGSTTSAGENWSGWDRSHGREHSGTSANAGGWNHGSSNWTRTSTESGVSASSKSSEQESQRGGRGHRHGDRPD